MQSRPRSAPLSLSRFLAFVRQVGFPRPLAPHPLSRPHSESPTTHSPSRAHRLEGATAPRRTITSRSRPRSARSRHSLSPAPPHPSVGVPHAQYHTHTTRSARLPYTYTPASYMCFACWQSGMWRFAFSSWIGQPSRQVLHPAQSTHSILSLRRRDSRPGRAYVGRLFELNLADLGRAARALGLGVGTAAICA